MPSLFADYLPHASGTPCDPQVEPLSPGRLEECARIAAAREGGDAARWRASLERSLDDPDRRTWVGLVGHQVAGYAGVARLTPRSTDPTCVAPDGWYLNGLVVDPAHRRRGVGRSLTAVRLAWLARVSDQAWYFASSLNRASLDLHAGFGFEVVATDVVIPGVPISGSALLYRLPLA